MRARHCARTMALAGSDFQLADGFSQHNVAADTPTGMKANEAVGCLCERVAEKRQQTRS